VSAKQNLSPRSWCLAVFCQLFGFALLVCAPHAGAGSLEDAAHELAMKVCLAGHKQPVKVAWAESTSSSTDLSDPVRKIFLDQLSACGMEGTEGSDVPVLTVTMRFTPSKVLLVANSSAPAAGEPLFVVEVPRASLFVARETSAAPQLRAELLWRQEKSIQSAIAWQDPATQERFLLLWSDGLLSRLRFDDSAWKTIDSAELPDGHRSRSGEGGFSYNRSKQKPELVLRKKACDLNLDGHVSLTCDGSELKERTAQLSSACEESPRYLATGKGDYTQPDRVTLGAIPAAGVAPSASISLEENSSGSVDMPGPVLDVSPAENSKAAFAVVKNLLTGNYEVYRITAVCGN
jgi:hypothetical protein